MGPEALRSRAGCWSRRRWRPAKQPYTTLRRTMHVHPTVSELIPTLLGDLKPLQ